MSRQFRIIIRSVIALVSVISIVGGGQIVQARELAEGQNLEALQTEKPEQTLAAENSAENVELLGHLGGIAQTIAVRGQYAYVGFGPELAVLDVSDPAHIQRVGWLLAAGTVEDIAVNGDFTYIAYAAGAVGLQVIDIHNPFTPISLYIDQFADCGGSPKVLISESSVYFAYTAGLCLPFGQQNEGAYLHRLDITNPVNPVVLNTYYQPMSSVVGYSTQNGWLYALWWDPNGTNLKVFDVSTPTGLVEIASQTVGDQDVGGIALVENYALIAAGNDGLKVVDISDPVNPGTLITFTLPGSAQKIFIDDSIAYVALDVSEIIILDVIDPLNPVNNGSYSSTGPMIDLFLNGSTAYSANGWGGAEIFDSVTLSQSGVIEYPQHPNEMAYSEPYAYISADDGFWDVDISNPRMPVPVAHLETDYPAVSLVLIGNYAYLALPGDGLWIIDISNPLAPFVAGTYNLPENLQQIIFVENRLYVAANVDGLHILELSNPLAPIEMGVYKPSYAINAVAVAGGHAYLATDNGIMPVLDISHPQSIEEVGLIDPSDEYPYCLNTDSIAVQANIVFQGGTCGGPTPLAGITGRVRLIDVSDPENPIEAGDLPDVNTPTWISLDASHAYIASYHDGLRVFDISNPASPQMIGSYTSPEVPVGVIPAGEYIFLYGNSTFILRYIDPALPAITGRITQANHRPYPGALVSAGSPILEKVSDVQGAYTFQGLVVGSYTLVPSLPGYVFSPPTRTVSLPPSAWLQNFTILPEPVSLDFTPGISATLIYTDTQGLPTWLDIPSNASTAPMTLQVVPTVGEDAPGYAFAGHAFELVAGQNNVLTPGFTFESPITVTIQYSLDDIAVVSDTGNLSLWWWDGTAWQDAAATCSPSLEYIRENANFTLSIPICQSGVYQLMGPTHQAYLPLVQVNH